MSHPSDTAADVPWYVLPALVVAQFAGTSLWFAINAIVPDLQVSLQWPATAVGTLTAALQFGFIVGTLLFALAMIADRFDPRWVFFLSSLGGAALTIVAWLRIDHYVVLLMCRFLTGLCLAGIYPVGMKIAAQWFPKGLGHALGWLVGALVLGSASAHGLRAVTASLPWETLMVAVAVLAVAGGLLVLSLCQRVPAQHRPVALTWSAFGVMWTNRLVRRPVLGYFGHMWELYTVWVLLPFILGTRLAGEPVLWWSFAIMGSGALGCVIGGHLVAKVGGVRVATTQLGISGLCCLLAPLMLQAPDALFYAWLLVWGITVAGDSPQFSALTASRAPSHLVGSILTMTNSIGFAISIVSILLSTQLAQHWPLEVVLPLLAVGPALGVWAMR